MSQDEVKQQGMAAVQSARNTVEGLIQGNTTEARPKMQVREAVRAAAECVADHCDGSSETGRRLRVIHLV